MDGGDLILPTILDDPLLLTVRPGMTLRELLAATGAPDYILARTAVTLNGQIVYDLDHILTMDGDVVGIFAVPEGGDNGGKAILSAIAMIAISIAAPYLAAGIMGYGFTGAGVTLATAAGGIGFYALTAGITLIGTMLVSALIPPPAAANANITSTSSPIAEGQVYRITGQSNQAKMYGVVPRIYGRHRFYPYLAATPIVDNVGKTSRVSALYDFGIGDLAISDIRIGNTGVEFLQPNMLVHENSFGTALVYVTKAIAYEEFSFQLAQNVPLSLRTHDESSRATLDIYFPSGLVAYDRAGDRQLHSVGFRVRWRKQGSGAAWYDVPAADFVGAKTDPQTWVYTADYDAGLDWGVTTGWYEYTYPRKKDVIYGLRIMYQGQVIYSWEWIDRPTDLLTEFWINGRPFRRGVPRESGDPAWGMPDKTVVTLSELLVPFATPGGSVTVSEATAQPFTVGVNLNFHAPGVYEVEVTRTTPINVGEGAKNTLRDVAVVTLLKSHKSGTVLNLQKRHTMIELAFTANDKVNGVIDNLNAIAWSRLRSCTASGWGPVITTSNPAYIALDILAGTVARQPLHDSQIDFASFYRLAQKCEQIVTQSVNGVVYTAPRFEWNGVIESTLTVQEALATVLGVARSAITFTTSGKIGVMIDEEKTQRRQMITPANSWNFEGVRTFTPLPHAFRVAFLDEENDWQATEVMVYRDGYGEKSATLIEDLRTYGITAFPEAYRFGRYMMAQGMMRSEVFHVNMDVENLAVQRGDLVAVQHDVPRFGGMAFRVVSTNGNEVTIDRPIEVGAGGSYTVRTLSGTVRQGKVVSQVDIDTFVLDNVAGIGPDDLLAMGTGEVATRDYIVQSIEPDVELTARLTLVQYVPGVYTADTGPLPPWSPGFGDQLGSTTNLAVDVTSVTGTWVILDHIPHLRIKILWTINNPGVYANSTIQVQIQDDLERTVTVRQDSAGQYSYDVHYLTPQYFNVPVKFLVTPRNLLGLEGKGDTFTTSFKPYGSAPLPPRNAFIDVRSQDLTMFWDASESLDVTRYVIRYTPELDNPTWEKSQHLARVTWDTSKFTTGARTGTYMIVAENIIGKLSTVVYCRTTVEQLPDMNIVEELLESPSWPGQIINMTKGYIPTASHVYVRTLDGVMVEVTLPPGVTAATVKKLDGTFVNVNASITIPTTSLVSKLTNTADLAFYVFQETVDTGDVYECRVVNYMQVGALDTINQRLMPERDDSWNAWLEYRAIIALSMMSTWPKLSTLGNISQGVAPWGDWRKVNVGDVTGRIFQFRMVAQVFEPGIQVIYSVGKLALDMPDRQWRKNNIAVPVAGVLVQFDPAFRSKPILAINIEGATTAVRYEVTGLDNLDAFITLKNSAGASVAGTIDVAALGYGRRRSALI